MRIPLSLCLCSLISIVLHCEYPSARSDHVNMIVKNHRWLLSERNLKECRCDDLGMREDWNYLCTKNCNVASIMNWEKARKDSNEVVRNHMLDYGVK